MSSTEPSARVHLVDLMATPAVSPTACHVEPGTDQALGQKVMKSALSILGLMKGRRAAQASTGRFTKGAPPTETVSKSQESQMNATEFEEPVTLRERLVFRTNVPIPADSFLALDAEAFINNSLVVDAELTNMAMEVFGEGILDCPDEDKILLRCALREVHEARLKTHALLKGLTPEEVRELELLQEVWKEEGVPNGSEMGLLCGKTGHRLHYLAGWFGEKQRSSKAYDAISRQMFPVTERMVHMRYRRLVAPHLKKPLHRH
ncbi:MAG: hypothetical protein Q9226_000305 [Calogaya cf. arnoldii]